MRIASKIASKDVIQADSPERVMATVDAVARGAQDDKAIAAAIGDLDARQGRYYRRAAEVLGFMMRDSGHRSTVTPAGNEFANAQPAIKQVLFVRAVLGNLLFQRLFAYLESKGNIGATRADLEKFLADVAELGADSMVTRRVSSYIGWLEKLALAKLVGSRLVLDRLPVAVPLVRYEADDEPIFPNRYGLEEYQEQARRVASKQEAIAYHVDRAKQERANTGHEALVNLMAQRLRQRGIIPKANRYVDLSARWQAVDYLFEMKSTTEINPHSQIRRGLSQLYEYRYIQNVKEAKLVLVIENPLPNENRWMADYLASIAESVGPSQNHSNATTAASIGYDVDNASDIRSPVAAEGGAAFRRQAGERRRRASSIQLASLPVATRNGLACLPLECAILTHRFCHAPII